LRANTHIFDRRLSMVSGRLTFNTLKTQIERARDRVARVAESARRCSQHAIELRRTRLRHSTQMLAALSYKSVLSRGFALVRD